MTEKIALALSRIQEASNTLIEWPEYEWVGIALADASDALVAAREQLRIITKAHEALKEIRCDYDGDCHRCQRNQAAPNTEALVRAGLEDAIVLSRVCPSCGKDLSD